ncbi:MAG: radical SAM protein, partial [Clostridiales bacterium]|nr:radical SAM protein [Clostridiales bacterium]
MSAHIEQTFLEAFSDEAAGIQFHGAWVFEKNGRYLLLERGGCMILLDKEQYQSLAAHTYSEDLLLKLIQRDFVSFAGEEQSGENHQESICPAFFMIDLTNRCNMACRYCLREDAISECAVALDRDTADRICAYIAKVCNETGIKNIMVQPWGGEPLLEKDLIFRIQDQLVSLGIDAQLTIETNGLLLSDACIRELYDRRVAVSVSIDGYREVHDFQRRLVGGGPSHAQVEVAIRRLQKVYGDEISIIATVTCASAPYIEEILDYFTGTLGLKNIKVNYVHQSAFHDNEDLCMSPEEIQICSRRVLDKIVALYKEGISVFEYNIWIKAMNLLTNRKLDVCSSGGCSGGKKMLTFDADGDIYPCDVTDFPEERMGNIADDGSAVSMVERAMEG